MPQAHLENPVIFVFALSGIFTVSLFPVLCPIMNVFLKNGEMEGFKIFAPFLMLETTFSALFKAFG